MTIRTLLESAAQRRPKRIALRYRRNGGWQSRSYSELALGVCQIAEALGRLGLRPGDERIAVILENGPEWVETYLAAAGAGVAVVPLDPKLRAEEVAFILGDSGAVTVVTDSRHVELLEAVLPALEAVRAVVVSDGGPQTPASVAGRPCHGDRKSTRLNSSH